MHTHETRRAASPSPSRFEELPSLDPACRPRTRSDSTSRTVSHLQKHSPTAGHRSSVRNRNRPPRRPRAPSSAPCQSSSGPRSAARAWRYRTCTPPCRAPRVHALAFLFPRVSFAIDRARASRRPVDVARTLKSARGSARAIVEISASRVRARAVLRAREIRARERTRARAVRRAIGARASRTSACAGKIAAGDGATDARARRC